jgi:hypothetical protein
MISTKYITQYQRRIIQVIRGILAKSDNHAIEILIRLGMFIKIG